MRLCLPVVLATCCLVIPQVYAQDAQPAGTKSTPEVKKEVTHKAVSSTSKEKTAHKLVAKKHHSKEVLAAQKDLLTLGYKEVGHADGLMGRKTMAAVKQFQKDHHLKVTGHVSKALVHELANAVHLKAKKAS
ncbi:peptidoglycan-binding domain-containing protein [Marinomonas spartinae]|uniref:peptidoglycan-binding domain-containing protein n=1 Tax=Marinomonas spartinae TaxID=1792290 RepID=UPI0018F111A8|nr:peptidoglycan-binding domain-containing protein [Marinomonas spartinae]MBJ7554942.1 peptidoglycan-binding protein [Marinomonas spartinae]